MTEPSGRRSRSGHVSAPVPLEEALLPDLGTSTGGPVDELDFDAGSTAPGRRRSAVVVAVVAAVLLLAGVGWISAHVVSPQLPADQVRRLYDPPPAVGLSWQAPAPLMLRPSERSGLVVHLGSPSCQESATALFHYLPDAARDGYLAAFTSASGRSWGVSSTTRYADSQGAVAEFRASVSSLRGCQRFRMPALYGSVAVTLTEEPVAESRLTGERVEFRLVATPAGSDLISTLTGLRYGNTVSWQTRNGMEGPDVEADAAARVMDALQSRIRAAGRGW